MTRSSDAEIVIGITGHRPSRVPDPAWLRSILEEQLLELRADRVLLGLADGTDQWVAAAAWNRGIPFVGVLPWRGHRQGSVAHDWCLRHAERVVEINPSQNYPGPSVYHERNEWIVSHSDILLAVWDGKRTGGTFQTVRRALLRKMPVRQINPLTREISSFNMDEPQTSLFSALDIDQKS